MKTEVKTMPAQSVLLIPAFVHLNTGKLYVDHPIYAPALDRALRRAFPGADAVFYGVKPDNPGIKYHLCLVPEEGDDA